MNIQRFKLTGVAFNTRQKFVIVMSVAVSGILVITSMGVNALQALDNWWDRHDLNFYSLKVEMPRVEVVGREPREIIIPVISTGEVVNRTILTEDEKKEVMINSGYYKILAGIRIIESSNNAEGDGTGHHVDCNKVGMSNEFGFSALDDFCFANFEESVEIVTAWLEDHLNEMNLNEALCVYNQGIRTSICEYAKNYHNLDNAGRLAIK